VICHRHHSLCSDPSSSSVPKNPVNSGTVRSFWNSITLKIFRNGPCIFWISTCKLYTALWITLFPLFCTLELIGPKLNCLCHYKLMSCSSSMSLETRSSWWWNFFLIFYMWRTCRQLQLLFYNRSPILLREISKNTSKWLYVNDFLLYNCSRATLSGATRTIPFV
jgi:hypothetical protein